MRHSDERDQRLAPGGVDRFEFLLDLEADGALSAAEAVELERLAASDRDLELRREAWRRFHDDLVAQRVSVRDGFADEVLDALPEAPWKATKASGWGVAAMAVAVLALLTTLALAFSSGSPNGAGIGLLAAVGEMLTTSLLTGAGLLGASWRGLGMALESLLAASPAALLVFGVGVVTLNVLFLRLLRRRRLAVGRSSSDSRPGDSRPGERS